MSGNITTPSGSLGNAIGSAISNIRDTIQSLTGGTISALTDVATISQSVLNHLTLGASLSVNISTGFSFENAFNGGGLTSVAKDFFFRVNDVQIGVAAAATNIDATLNFGALQVDLIDAEVGVAVTAKLARPWSINIGDIVDGTINTNISDMIVYDGTFVARLPSIVTIESPTLREIIGDAGMLSFSLIC
jgi:hypothetical protein